MSSKGSCSKMNMMAYMPWVKLIIALGLIICFAIIASAYGANNSSGGVIIPGTPSTNHDEYMRMVSLVAILLCVASAMTGAYALFAVWCLAIGVFYVNNGYTWKVENAYNKNIKNASIVAIVLSTLGVVLHSGDLWMATQKFGK